MRGICNVRKIEKKGRKFVTFETFHHKTCVEHRACLIGEKWLDIDTGHDWSDSIIHALEKAATAKANKNAVKGLREILDA